MPSVWLPFFAAPAGATATTPTRNRAPTRTDQPRARMRNWFGTDQKESCATRSNPDAAGDSAQESDGWAANVAAVVGSRVPTGWGSDVEWAEASERADSDSDPAGHDRDRHQRAVADRRTRRRGDPSGARRGDRRRRARPRPRDGRQSVPRLHDQHHRGQRAGL